MARADTTWALPSARAVPAGSPWAPPNTSAHLGAGFPMIVHPGEAIVPLPDGGSISVDFG